MLLFFKIFAAIFIAEMGDKTQFLMIAMTSRYKTKDIILGSACSILALNALAVAAGSIISEVIPEHIIKIIAALAFFYFAWSSMAQKDDDDGKQESFFSSVPPAVAVFSTFFLAEFGDKTQLTAITFAANEGTEAAVLVCLACSLGLFSADMIGIQLGKIIKDKTSDSFLDRAAFVLFLIFGGFTAREALLLSGAGSAASTGAAIFISLLFLLICLAPSIRERIKLRKKTKNRA